MSRSNAAAAAALDAWPDWRGGTLVLVGGPGSGKTHLAAIWARRVAAHVLTPDGSEPRGFDRPILVDDADRTLHDAALFHLINLAVGGAGLLMTARSEPGRWPAQLPDLRSRLNALPVTHLLAPDDVVLRAMLENFFRERNLRPTGDLLTYLVRRIERSAVQAREVVAELDEAAGDRPLSRALARQVLGDMSQDDAP